MESDVSDEVKSRRENHPYILLYGEGTIRVFLVSELEVLQKLLQVSPDFFTADTSALRF